MRRAPFVVASLATVPSRRALLERVVASLLPQVDELWVFFDQLTPTDRAYAILDVTRHAPKVRSWDPGDFQLGDAAKFAPLRWCRAPELIYLTCDDDLVYPRDYVARMREAVAREPDAVHTAHGGVLRGHVERWREAIRFTAYRAGEALGDAEDGRSCNVPGTGCLAARAELLHDFECPLRPLNVADLHLAVWLQQRRIPVRTVGHARGWLATFPDVGETLWDSGEGVRSQPSREARRRRDHEDAVVQQIEHWEVF